MDIHHPFRSKPFINRHKWFGSLMDGDPFKQAQMDMMSILPQPAVAREVDNGKRRNPYLSLSSI